jgi:hypothetical protein
MLTITTLGATENSHCLFFLLQFPRKRGLGPELPTPHPVKVGHDPFGRPYLPQWRGRKNTALPSISPRTPPLCWHVPQGGGRAYQAPYQCLCKPTSQPHPLLLRFRSQNRSCPHLHHRPAPPLRCPRLLLHHCPVPNLHPQSVCGNALGPPPWHGLWGEREGTLNRWRSLAHSIHLPPKAMGVLTPTFSMLPFNMSRPHPQCGHA